MTLADKIYDALKDVKELPPISYYDSGNTKLPRMVFFLVSNVSKRLSNQRHSQRPVYQISYFSSEPLDVISDEKLGLVTRKLEEIDVYVGDWQEAMKPDEGLNVIGYHYFVEVR